MKGSHIKNVTRGIFDAEILCYPSNGESPLILVQDEGRKK